MVNGRRDLYLTGATGRRLGSGNSLRSVLVILVGRLRSGFSTGCLHTRFSCEQIIRRFSVDNGGEELKPPGGMSVRAEVEDTGLLLRLCHVFLQNYPTSVSENSVTKTSYK